MKDIKYVLSNIETTTDYGVKIRRIIANRDIGDDVKKGDLGGWVNVMSSFYHIDEYDESWLYEDAVLLSGTITNNSKINCRSLLTRCHFYNTKIIGNKEKDSLVYCHCHNYKSKYLKDETIFFYDCEIKVDGVIDIIIDSNNIFKMTGNMYIPEDSQIELFGNKHVITQSYI